MKLRIHDPEGTLVGEVDLYAELEPDAHRAYGAFTPGPGFPPAFSLARATPR